MQITRREFLQMLAAASAVGLRLDSKAAIEATDAEKFYDLPRFGNVSLLHFTDCHAQLLPLYHREPNFNVGLGASAGRPPHLVGEHLLRRYGIPSGSREAYAFTHLDFAQAARTYGKVGGFAHLATLVKQLRADRPGALLLDGGDTWQGSATALWTNGQDMVDTCKLLGVDVMTGHWEFTLGAGRVKQIIDKDLRGKIEFLAQNVSTADFGDPVFPGHAIREVQGVKFAVIGQAFPYTPIANPAYKIPDWTFGIQEAQLQRTIDSLRGRGCAVVVLLSHNGADVDLKLASRVTGIDVILGGHTHDAMPQPVLIENRNGKTLVTNAGSNGKFLAVLDLKVEGNRVADYRYRLLPVFSNLLAADADMQALIERHRKPFAKRLEKKLGETNVLLYRRGNFTGSFDQLILDALMKVMDTEIAFSPGFRWGTALLPGEAITWESLLAQTAITYPYVQVQDLSGAQIKNTLEEKADNLFNPDPYLQQGGDMTRVGGLRFKIDPSLAMGKRIGGLHLRGRPLAAHKRYKVASWAPTARGASGPPVWNVIAQYLRTSPLAKAPRANVPEVVGIADNPGFERA
jgi:S-sulfosulfanyl-L-cysteine sulfohydrolase